MAATSSIFDGGLNKIGTNFNGTIKFTGLTASGSGLTNSISGYIYDAGLNIIGTVSNSGIRIPGLTLSVVSATAGFTNILDGDLNIIGRHFGPTVSIPGLSSTYFPL